VGVQEVRWEGSGTVPAGEYTFCMERGMRILGGRWYDIIVLNVHAPTEDKTDYVKDSFYEELERAFHTFPKYHMKIFL
jgi:hypothetical protein